MKYLKTFESFDQVNLENNFSQIIDQLEYDPDLKSALIDFVKLELPQELKSDEVNQQLELEYNESFSLSGMWSRVKNKIKELFTISPKLKLKIGNFLQSLGIFTIVGGVLASQAAPLISQFKDNELSQKVYQALLDSNFGKMYVEKFGQMDHIEAGVYLMLATIAVSIVTGTITMKAGEKISQKSNNTELKTF